MVCLSKWMNVNIRLHEDLKVSSRGIRQRKPKIDQKMCLYKINVIVWV